MRALRVRLLAVAIAGSAWVAQVANLSSAHAGNVFEYPEQGSEPLGRGGAWVARATDPIAIARNPAGLAGQPNRVSVGYDLALRHMCFTRTKAAGDITEDGFAPGDSYPRVCDTGAPIPVGYVAFARSITERLTIGGGIVTPSGVPRTELPMFVGTSPAPQRYLLLESTTLMAIPTVSAAYEIVPSTLRVGASLGWGIAWVRTAAAAPGIIEGAVRPADNDVKVRVTALDAFVPRVTLGAHWSPSPFVEVGASGMWSDSIRARGDAVTEANAFTPRAATGDDTKVAHGDTSRTDCGRAGSTACGDGGNAQLTIPLPATVTLGVRLRLPRSDRAEGRERDPIDDDVFDVEIDASWSNNESIDRFGLRFPGSAGAGTIPVPGTAGTLPENADTERRYRDVVAFRLGGDAVVVPHHLSIRAGTFLESRAAVPGYVGLEAVAGQRIGLSLGATARFDVGTTQDSTRTRARHKPAVDLSVAYLRMFVADIDSTSPNAGGIAAIAGTSPYRTPWPVSLGRITSSLDVLHVGAAYRF